MYFKLEIYDDSEFKKMLYKQDGIVQSYDWNRPENSYFNNSYFSGQVVPINNFYIDLKGIVKNSTTIPVLQECFSNDNDISNTRFSKILGNK
jgi:hypothetical protein